MSLQILFNRCRETMILNLRDEVPEIEAKVIGVTMTAQPSNRAKTVLGWYDERRKVVHLNLPHRTVEPKKLINTILHELCHAVVGNKEHHKAATFGKMAERCGLTKPYTKTPWADEIPGWVEDMIKDSVKVRGFSKKKAPATLVKLLCNPANKDIEGCGTRWYMTHAQHGRALDMGGLRCPGCGYKQDSQ